MDTIELSLEQRKGIAEKKATCPFMGSAVRSGVLGVGNSAERPLAAIAEVVNLGDSGGGDLGRHVLELFAAGNHRRVPDASGAFKMLAPEGTMSLDLAGSQGAHPGHSGILLGDPTALDAGRFSAGDFERLARHADANGRISTQAMGEFVAENLVRDQDSKVLIAGDLSGLASDLSGLVGEIGNIVKSLGAKFFGARQAEQDGAELREKLTKLGGKDNLVGSSGEFGLLFALLANRPEPDVEGDPGIRLEDIELMFVHHRFPSGWETWPKKASDWVHATIAIAASARAAYMERKLKNDSGG